MAYVQTEWVAGVTPLSEANMDHLETQYDEAAADLVTHAALTATHGVAGAIVGTTDAQSLSNKTLGNALILNGQDLNAGAGDMSVITTGVASGGTITSSQDGAAGAALTLRHNSASPAINDKVAIFSGLGRNDAAQWVSYAEIMFRITDETDETEDGRIEFNTMRNKTMTQAMTLSNLGALGLSGGITLGTTGVTFPDATVQASKAMVPEVFVPVDGYLAGTETRAVFSKRPGVLLNVGGERCFFKTFVVPSDFTSLTSCKVLCGSTDATPDVDWTIATEFAAVGEAFNAHTDSVTADNFTPTQNQMSELDVTAAFTGLAVGDSIGAEFTLDVVTDGSLIVLGFTFIYA